MSFSTPEAFALLALPILAYFLRPPRESIASAAYLPLRRLRRPMN